ncbi:DUF1439 domain-containing protein [Massilia sp. Leaf139]|uniref:DUF1439 domain-containing protein n=1 Tax=Massilia sp. Leaf139 TaxID=1736272 RepID=UPI0006F75501|nr:DUF1439 domain-containing protein [Massilia sp. Leaf139]KQQ88624.1 hypothetical protein ASF77_13345 [Massilia sp. Leaf139]
MADQHTFRARRVFLIASSLAVAATLSSCASILGPREVDLPLSKLQASLDRRFPMDNRLLELFDLRLSRPQLSVLPGDRVALSMDASVAQSFLRNPLSGSLAFSGRLYVDQAKNGVYLAEPRLERFAISGLDESVSRQLSRAANGLLDQAILDIPVYSFRMDELRYAGVQYVPTRIATTATGLRVSLEPAPRP